MTAVKAIIVDDEKQLRSHLKSQLIQVWPDLEIVGEAKSGREALVSIEELQPDLVFLDIKMPGLSGLEVAQRIPDKCWIVFVTAYDQYAIEAFEREAVDYLLKPVTIQRLEKTVDRIKKKLSSHGEHYQRIQKLMQRLETLSTDRPGPTLQWIKSQLGTDIRLISVDDVLYFIARDKYTAVITEEGECLIQSPIKELAGELDPHVFWQVSRGTIVNVHCIDKVSRSVTGRYQLRLKSHPEVLTVSRTYAHLFKQM